MTLIQLLDKHYLLSAALTFFAIVFVTTIILSIVSMVGRLINRVIRHRNLAKVGWPPAYLDADGDLTSVLVSQCPNCGITVAHRSLVDSINGGK